MIDLTPLRIENGRDGDGWATMAAPRACRYGIEVMVTSDGTSNALSDTASTLMLE
jgi:hypothetical protein